jgi:hypothetical protein
MPASGILHVAVYFGGDGSQYLGQDFGNVVKAGDSPADDRTTIIVFRLSAHVDLPNRRPSIPQCCTIVHIMCTHVDQTGFGHFVRSEAVFLGRIPPSPVTEIEPTPATGGAKYTVGLYLLPSVPKLYLSFGVYH